MEEKEMSFWGHLEELRRTLFRVVAVLLVFMIACFCVMPDLFDSFVLGPTTSDFFLYRWLSNLGGTGMFLPDFSNDDFAVEIININVASQFLTHISTSFWFALVLMFPYLIFEVWRFVQPALFENERRSVGLAFLGGTVMFFLGCAVGYCLVFPFTFRFLTEYQLSASIVNQISLNSYMGNFLMLVFVMGIVFELPLLAWLLSKLGLVNKTFFRTYRRHAAGAFGRHYPFGRSVHADGRLPAALPALRTGYPDRPGVAGCGAVEKRESIALPFLVFRGRCGRSRK